MGDFDNFIRHTDFRKVLQLADLLKDQKASLEGNYASHEFGESISNPSSPLQTRAKKSAFGDSSRREISGSRGGVGREPNAYDSAADLIRASLIPSSNSGSTSMERGKCAITDSLIDETIESLAKELRMYLDIKKQRRARRVSQDVSEHSFNSDETMVIPETSKPVWMGAGVTLKGNTVGGKINYNPERFAKWQTDIMTDWMVMHKVSCTYGSLLVASFQMQ